MLNMLAKLMTSERLGQCWSTELIVIIILKGVAVILKGVAIVLKAKHNWFKVY